MNIEVICTFIFLIAISIFLILSLETQKRIYLYISMSLVGLYLVFVIYLINKNGITLLFIIHHSSIFLFFITSYLYTNEDNKKGNRRNSILKKVNLGLCLLIMFTIPKWEFHRTHMIGKK